MVEVIVVFTLLATYGLHIRNICKNYKIEKCEKSSIK